MELYRIFAVICIPLLMLSDYFLTLLGKKLRDREYYKYFTTEEYELNPAWQKDINRQKLFNYKHLLAVFLITVYFYFASKLMRDTLFDFFFGALFIIYSFIITRHLQNIFTYKLSSRFPQYLNGKLSISYIYTIKLSQYQTIFFALFLFLINFWVQSWFIAGGVTGLVILYLIQFAWIKRYRQKAAAQQPHN